jgi:hypothetical protein
MIDPKECKHQEWHTNAQIFLMEDTGHRIVTFQIKCTQCDTPFSFVGVEHGIFFDRPSLSVDGLDLTVPIEP